MCPGIPLGLYGSGNEIRKRYYTRGADKRMYSSYKKATHIKISGITTLKNRTNKLTQPQRTEMLSDYSQNSYNVKNFACVKKNNCSSQ
jgi:hypothetical protein